MSLTRQLTDFLNKNLDGVADDFSLRERNTKKRADASTNFSFTQINRTFHKQHNYQLLALYTCRRDPTQLAAR